MEHHFLIAAYVITWVFQLGYLARLLIMSQQLKSAAARMQKK